MRSHTIPGGGGTELNVDETGNPDGRAILFIHGYTQSRLSWRKQLASDLADEFRLVAIDNRGHGLSEKPDDAYADSELWAEDVQSVIDALELDAPVLVGWSYGGLIISDYLGTYGDDRITGINLVGAISQIGTEHATALIGEDFLELVPGFESSSVRESVDTLETFIRRCTYDTLPPEDLRMILGFNTIVPPHVREALHSRSVTHVDDLRAVEVPVLITHGEEDTVVLPEAGREHADLIGTAETSMYPDTGHSPFWERPDRYNRELHEFVSSL